MTANQPAVNARPVEPGPLERGPVEPEPVLSVIKGNPSAEELAALTAVVLSISETPTPRPHRPSTRHWVRRAQLHLAPKPGPGAWRRSG